MKWNIDREILKLEPEGAAGTMINRVLMDVKLFKESGIKPTPAQLERGHGHVWCIALGKVLMPKAFFYGHTIREAFLKARKAAKAGKLFAPWGEKVEVRGYPPKKHRRRRERPRPAATAG